MPDKKSHRVKLLLIYISSELDDYFRFKLAPTGYEVQTASFKNSNNRNELIQWADAIFIQWDGRGQSAHEMFLKLNDGMTFKNLQAPVYAMTTSNIRIETLSPKVSRQLNIAGWFDIPHQDEALKKELALLIPDEFDDFKADIEKAKVQFFKELPLNRLGGKHLIGQIKSAWSERDHRAKTTSRLRDDVTKSHVSYFHSSDSWGGELIKFLSELKFKYYDEYRNVTDCMRRLRGQGTDMLVAFYQPDSRDCEELLRMQLEIRHFKRIPIVVVYMHEDDLQTLKKTTSDLYIDRFVAYDRNKDKFRSELLKAFDSVSKDLSARRLLDDLRALSQDFTNESPTITQQSDMEAACDKIAADPKKQYWADAERLLGAFRFKDSGSFHRLLAQFEMKYSHVDALITMTAARAGFVPQEANASARQLLQKITSSKDFNFDRLVRVSVLLSRLGTHDALKTLLILWWGSKDNFPVEHEFYWAASRWAKLNGFLALERALLAHALKLEPCRIEYIEAYANHLIATNHAKYVVEFADFLKESIYFPAKKSALMLLNALIKEDNKVRASAVLMEMIARWPLDRSLIVLKQKLGLA